MAEHIRKQAILNLIDEFQFNHETNTWGVTKDGVVVLKPDTLDKLHEAVKAMPAEDVVKIVRCKDCKNLYPDDTGKLHWCDCHRMFVGLDDFCNYGKRKDGGESDEP